MKTDMSWWTKLLLATRALLLRYTLVGIALLSVISLVIITRDVYAYVRTEKDNVNSGVTDGRVLQINTVQADALVAPDAKQVTQSSGAGKRTDPFKE